MHRKETSQRGQTLIETVIGIFIMTMGITSAIGLASYALGASGNVVKQMVGAGLAREGLEAVKNMRDTNWLKSTGISSTCWNYQNLTPTAKCYTDWLNRLYNFNPNPTATDTFVLDIDTSASSSQPYWDLDLVMGNNASRYWLYYDDDASTGRLYSTSGGNGNIPSDYRREILIELDTTAPYYQATIGPRLKVTSRVWWVGGKGCPVRADTWTSSTNACRVSLVTYLTNWKNY